MSKTNTIYTHVHVSNLTQFPFCVVHCVLLNVYSGSVCLFCFRSLPFVILVWSRPVWAADCLYFASSADPLCDLRVDRPAMRLQMRTGCVSADHSVGKWIKSDTCKTHS